MGPGAWWRGEAGRRLCGERPRIFTLPPSSHFLDELAAGLIAATGAKKTPEALADALIFTPNRRTQRELALSLFNALGVSMLAPEIRALGDIEEDDAVSAFGQDVLDLDPAMSARRPARRACPTGAGLAPEAGQGKAPAALAALGRRRTRSRCWIRPEWRGGVDWSKLKALVPEADFALHWQNAATFLAIITKAWPKYLEEAGASDAPDPPPCRGQSARHALGEGAARAAGDHRGLHRRRTPPRAS